MTLKKNQISETTTKDCLFFKDLDLKTLEDDVGKQTFKIKKPFEINQEIL